MSQTSNGNVPTSNAPVQTSGSPAASSVSGTPAGSSTSVNTIPQTAPPGTISFTMPAQTVSASYYKIMANNPLTFGWNFTSLISTPAALTVQAYCSQNGNTYPVGPTNAQGLVDGIIPGTATAVTWDAYAQQTAQNGIRLATATYTLRIFDERGLTAGIEPGKLQVNQNVKFAMYSPASYTPIASGWQCTGCNSSATVHAPTFFALSMTLLVMLVSGVGFLRGLVRN